MKSCAGLRFAICRPWLSSAGAAARSYSSNLAVDAKSPEPVHGLILDAVENHNDSGVVVGALVPRGSAPEFRWLSREHETAYRRRWRKTLPKRLVSS